MRRSSPIEENLKWGDIAKRLRLGVKLLEGMPALERKPSGSTIDELIDNWEAYEHEQNPEVVEAIDIWLAGGNLNHCRAETLGLLSCRMFYAEKFAADHMSCFFLPCPAGTVDDVTRLLLTEWWDMSGHLRAVNEMLDKWTV